MKAVEEKINIAMEERILPRQKQPSWVLTNSVSNVLSAEFLKVLGFDEKSTGINIIGSMQTREKKYFPRDENSKKTKNVLIPWCDSVHSRVLVLSLSQESALT